VLEDSVNNIKVYKSLHLKTNMHSRFVPLVGGIIQLTDEWFTQRKGRLTGSKLANFCFIKDEAEYDNYFGIVFEGKPKPPFTEKQLGWMKYGREHEDIAICAFLNDAPSKVGDIYIAESPFYKHSDPSVGASPDGTYAIYKEGKIVEEGVIEVKCPGKAPNRPYPKWKYYYVPQTFWEMACSGHKKAIAISWGPRNMRAWKYSWDEKYWTVLCNIVDAFRKHVPYPEFQELQAQLIQESNRIANNAQCLHTGSGWKQKPFKIPKERTKQTKEVKIPKERTKQAETLASFASKDLLYAEVKFAQDTDWFKNNLPKLIPTKRDRDREFVIMHVGDKYKLIPGFAPKGEIILTGNERIIATVKYNE